MYHKILPIWILSFVPIFLWGQSISIRVVAKESGEPMYHAHARNHRTQEGQTADTEGRISLVGRPGDTITISYVGYRDSLLTLSEGQSSYTVALAVQAMDEVVIFAEDPFNRRAAEGRQNLSMEFIEALPSFNGDPDIMKSITFLPGVSAGKDGYAHMFVRGGDQDENLILLDGAPLYNVNHFAGLVSMFHSDMIRSVDFYKGYWPSRYGGRLSSVMDIHSKSGNYKEHKFSADLSPISTKAHLSGPLWKDKVSYMIGGRRTFMDLLFLRHRVNQIKKGDREGNSPLFTFYDVNGKVTARIGNNQQLSFSAFRGSDKLFLIENESGYISDDEYNILNQTYALNYVWHRDETTAVRGHLSSSSYRHFFEDLGKSGLPNNMDNQKGEEVDYRHTGNTIRTLKAMIHGDKKIDDLWEINFGVDHETIRYDLYLDRTSGLAVNGNYTPRNSTDLKGNRQPAYVSSIFTDAVYHVNGRLRIKAGIRLPRYQYDDYINWMYEPKALVSYDLTPNTTLNAAYNLQRQYSHLLSYTESEGYFREFYTTSDRLTPPSRSHQWSMGAFHHFRDRNSWLSEANVSLEVFYKHQSLLNRFQPGIDPDVSVVQYDEHLLRNGTSNTYGMEFLMQKTAGKFHGSLSYTWAHSKSQFEGLNHGRSFNADFDYRNSVNILLIYKFRKGYQLSAQWDYRSGRPFTLSNSLSTRDEIISGRYPMVKSINNSRLPAYHRLDLSLDREWFTKKRGNKQWFGISFYNVCNHVNPFYAYPENGRLTVKGFIPIIPGFHYGFEL